MARVQSALAAPGTVITDETMWGGSNYGEGSVRSGRSRYSLSLMRACGADPTLARVQSALAAPVTVFIDEIQIHFFTDEGMWDRSNYGEGSVRSGRSRYSYH
jgi:hypothetical protein